LDGAKQGLLNLQEWLARHVEEPLELLEPGEEDVEALREVLKSGAGRP
jgi:hypothetical protein